MDGSTICAAQTENFGALKLGTPPPTGERFRTLTTHAELTHDGDHVARDCVQVVRPDWHPVEAYIRIQQDQAWSGSGWFRFTDDGVLLDRQSRDEGDTRDTANFDGPLRGFGTHGLQADAWLAAAFPFGLGSGSEHRWPVNLTHSLHHLGASGPTISTTTSGLRYVGDESVKTAAGKFDCRRIQFVGFTNDHPPYDMWITREDEPIYVRGEVGGYLASSFELSRLER